MSTQNLTLLRLAECGDFSGLHLHLEQNTNVDVNYQDQGGASALIACVNGFKAHPEVERSEEFISCGRLLLESGINLNAQDVHGRTALHWAVCNNHVGFVENLLEAKADTTLLDDNGQTVIHLALSTNATGCLQAICGHTTTWAMEQPNKQGMTPLVWAVQKCDALSTEILLDNGVEVNSANGLDNGKTAAHYAVGLSEGASILKVLLRYDADIIAQTTDGSSVLCLASSQKDPACLKLLTDEKKVSGREINQSDHHGKTPLMNACQKGLTENVKILADAGADLLLRDENGWSCIWYAIESKNIDCVRYVLDRQPSLGKLSSNKDGRTPLQLAIFEGTQDMVSLMIQYSDIHAKDNEDHNSIHWATACGKAYLIEMLAEAGADIEAVDIHGARPLHYAAKLCTTSLSQLGLECTMALLKRKATVDCRDNGRKTPLLWAASQGADECCKILLNAGADVLAKDDDGLTVLHYATCCNHPTFMELLVRDFNCPSDTPDGRGRTPLYFAIKGGLTDAVKILLKHGCNGSWQDDDGNSPAHLAASLDSQYCLQILQQFGGNLELKNKKGTLPIHEAAKDDHIDALSFLLHAGCRVNAANDAGMTPLHLAASSGSLSACNKLIDAGADINAVYQNEKGYPVTALDLASPKSAECAKLLETKGAKKGEEFYLPLIQVDEHVTDEIETPAITIKSPKVKDLDSKGSYSDKQLMMMGNGDYKIPQIVDDVYGKQLHQNNNNSKEDEVKSSSSSIKSTDNKMEKNRGHTETKQRVKETGRADVLQKILNWSKYEKEQTSLFDDLLQTTSPSLAEHRERAKIIKSEMLKDLREKKKQHDENVQQLAEEMSNKEIRDNAKDLDSLNKRAESVMKRLQLIQTAKPLPASKKVKKRRKSTRHKNSSPQVDGDLDEEEERKIRHKNWLAKKNKEYIQKKEAVRPKSCPRIDPEVVAATVGMKALWQESHEYKLRRVLSVTRNRPSNVPDYARSPYSNRTTGECGLYRAYSTKDTNEFYNLHGTEVAARHRQRGNELNSHIYPKSWQIHKMDMNGNQQETEEEVYDLKACYSPRWDGKLRPRNPLRFQSSSERSSSGRKSSSRLSQHSS